MCYNKKMKMFSATYGDIIKFNRKPNEDCLLISKKYPIFAVADGVTRGIFKDKRYAYPAGARAAAAIFCFTVIEYLERHILPLRSRAKGGYGVGEDLIKKAFDGANAKIHELNENEGMEETHDWYTNDYFDCVGVAALLAKNTIYYGYVGDCGLAIFDRTSTLKFQTKDQVANSLHHKEMRKIAQQKSMDRKARIAYIHKNFRNNPSGKYYGTFSGEKGVKTYHVAGNQKLAKGDLVILYSDGFAEYLKSKEFLRIVRKGDKEALDDFAVLKALTSPAKFGTDRTLISFVF